MIIIYLEFEYPQKFFRELALNIYQTVKESFLYSAILN